MHSYKQLVIYSLKNSDLIIDTNYPVPCIWGVFSSYKFAHWFGYVLPLNGALEFMPKASILTLFKGFHMKLCIIYFYMYLLIGALNNGSFRNVEIIQRNNPWESGQSGLAPSCRGYHYGTTSFNKIWTHVLRRLKFACGVSEIYNGDICPGCK